MSDIVKDGIVLNNLSAIEKYRDGIYQVCSQIQNIILQLEIKNIKHGMVEKEEIEMRGYLKTLIIWVIADLEVEGIDTKEWLGICEHGELDELYELYFKVLRMLKRLNMISLNGPEVLL
jgi:hypothetical protein